SMVISRVISPCASWHWGQCFVGETHIARRWKDVKFIVDAGSTSSPATLNGCEWNNAWLFAGAGALVITYGLHARKNRKRREEEELDDYFASDFIGLPRRSKGHEPDERLPIGAAAEGPKSKNDSLALQVTGP